MPYTLCFISLGCAKNRVNCEQMMALAVAAGHTIQIEPQGADVVIVNTCGFLAAACEEAIDTVLEIAELKRAGLVKKILVTGCMAQRYQREILSELPEADGILGTGSYDRINDAIAEVMTHGNKPCFLGDIHTANQSGERILSTPPWYAYLRIAEGCDNRCAYCVIPSLRGRYRSRPMDELLQEASELSDAGVKELIVIAQDITHYGLDLNGKRQLPDLLRALCQFDFHWIRLHYLYPSDITDELIETIASEEKILPYLDIPIQHCNDSILKSMRRRDTKAGLYAIFTKLRDKIPGLVLRTSIITGLPGEGPDEFDELCDFLREIRIERAGVFPFSPEDGTPAANMQYADEAEAKRRAEIAVDVESEVIDAYQEASLGTIREVLCEGFDPQAQRYYGRSYAESPEIDGRIWFDIPDTTDNPDNESDTTGNPTDESDTTGNPDEITPGTFVSVRLSQIMDGELYGTAML